MPDDAIAHAEPSAATPLQRAIPWALVATRVVLAPVAVWIAYADLPRWLWLAQGAAAALSDIYDGKLARRWGVVTGGLRQADSVADTIYALGVAWSFWLAEPEVVKDHLWPILIIIGLEAARYPLDWIKFGRGASYHATSARAFGISLILSTFTVMGFGVAWPFLWLSMAIGLYSEVEGVAISLVLPRWTHDVASVRVALDLRRRAASEPATVDRPPGLVARYHALPEKVRMVTTALLGALIGLATYEVIFAIQPFEPRAPVSWAVAFLIGVVRQHGLHRWLTFPERRGPYLASLGRAYLMYAGSLCFGTVLDWSLTEGLGVHHRLAWLACLLSTATISLVFLKRFVFLERVKPIEP